MDENIETAFTGAEDPVAIFWDALHELGVFSDSTVCAHDMTYTSEGEMQGTLLVSFGPTFDRKVDKDKVLELADALNEAIESRYLEELAVSETGSNEADEDDAECDACDACDACKAVCGDEDDDDEEPLVQAEELSMFFSGKAEEKGPSHEEIADMLRRKKIGKLGRMIEKCSDPKDIRAAVEGLERIIDKLSKVDGKGGADASE